LTLGDNVVKSWVFAVFREGNGVRQGLLIKGLKGEKDIRTTR